MDNGVSAGSTASTSTLGHIALGLTLLAFGIGHTGVIDGVTAAGSVSLATYVGGLALFVLGLLEFRGGNGFNGTAFAGLGAFWFTWAAGATERFPQTPPEASSSCSPSSASPSPWAPRAACSGRACTACSPSPCCSWR